MAEDEDFCDRCGKNRSACDMLSVSSGTCYVYNSTAQLPAGSSNEVILRYATLIARGWQASGVLESLEGCTIQDADRWRLPPNAVYALAKAVLILSNTP